MLTGEIRSQIDAIWNAFWTGGISNPLEVIEQINYLLFLRRLDDLQTLEELKAQRLKKPIERRIFPEGKPRANRRREIILLHGQDRNSGLVPASPRADSGSRIGTRYKRKVFFLERPGET
jgi:hypothetical protein